MMSLTFGQKLRWWRTQERLTWADLADLLEVRPVDVGKIEMDAAGCRLSESQRSRLLDLGFGEAAFE